ncbi:MAG: ATP-binding protein [bacterium]|nr:ATP-binding protein [bacterium]
MRTMMLQKIGPIRRAELSFGDLTVLVGPQATGKSIALEFLKLLLDKGQVLQQLTRYGIDWSGKVDGFIDAYFGEGMHAIWSAKSTIARDGGKVTMKQLARRGAAAKTEKVFMIPAQRVLALRNGWPRPFADYAPGDPFAVRDFSEKLRILAEQEFGAKEQLFPRKGRLKKGIRDLLIEHVFGGFSLKIDKVASQKRLVLEHGGDPLPHMVWSAGQREFVPLLLGLYWLMPSARVSTRGDIQWVVLEELEMGLHPRAVSVVLLMVLELVWRGYKVCVSTHATQVLEAVWAIRQLQETNAGPRHLLRMFNSPLTQQMQGMASGVLEKTFKVYYFDRETGSTSDISCLDPDAEDDLESRWGGLGEFSARANEAVASAVAMAEHSK